MSVDLRPPLFTAGGGAKRGGDKNFRVRGVAEENDMSLNDICPL